MTGAQPSAARTLVSLLVARAAFGLAFLATAGGAAWLPWYLPLERRWVFAVRPDGLAMDWFGRTAVAFVAAAITGAAVYAASGSAAGARLFTRRRVLLGIARAVALVVVLDFVYLGWAMMTRARAPSGVAAAPAVCAP